jgi:nucleoside phosphorylase
MVASGARSCTVASTLSITTDDALAALLAPKGDVEHLEAYGVARACQSASVPCAIVLGIANRVGAKGREEWRAHHLTASARTAELVRRAIWSAS